MPEIYTNNILQKNQTSLVLNSNIDNISFILIRYSGSFAAESLLLNNWEIRANENKIIMFIKDKQYHTMKGRIEIMNYVGDINLKQVIIMDSDNNKYNIPCGAKELYLYDSWEACQEKFSDSVEYYSGFNREKYKSTYKVLSTSIVSNNLITGNDEFYYKNYKPYNGEYHMHQDGQAMTGEIHSKDSVYIYRKRQSGLLLNPRRRMVNRLIFRKIQKDKKVVDILAKIKAETRSVKIGPGPPTPQGTAYIGGGTE